MPRASLNCLQKSVGEEMHAAQAGCLSECSDVADGLLEATASRRATFRPNASLLVSHDATASLTPPA